MLTSSISYDLDITQGSTFYLEARVKDVSGNPLVISGYNVRGSIRGLFGSTGVVTDLSCSVLSQPSGLVSVSLSPSQTSVLPVIQGAYNVEIYNSDESDVLKILYGYANISPGVAQ